MVNVYKIKVYGALILSPLITVISFVIAAQFFGFMWGLVGMAIGILTSVIISKLLINNPFSLMLEGQGILTLNMDSTGIIRNFLVSVNSPYISNTKEKVSDIFDRNAVHMYANPAKNRKPLEILPEGGVRITLDKSQMINVLKSEEFTTIDLGKNEYKIIDKKGGLFSNKTISLELTAEAIKKVKEATNNNLTIIELDEKTYNEARFAMMNYPCIIWNDQIKSVLTKDFFSQQEKTAFAEHQVIYLNRKVEDLTSAIRDFGRYVVELTRPKEEGWLKNKWTWIIIALAIVIIIALFAPSIIGAIKGTAGAAAGAVGNANNALSGAAQGTVTPR